MIFIINAFLSVLLINFGKDHAVCNKLIIPLLSAPRYRHAKQKEFVGNTKRTCDFIIKLSKFVFPKQGMPWDECVKTFYTLVAKHYSAISIKGTKTALWITFDQKTLENMAF